MKTLEQVKEELKNYEGRELKIMEVCGTHTASIFKSGIRSLLSPKIQLISGPGCPVCVSSTAYIDKLVEYSMKSDHCVLSFGDMMKVKGGRHSLTQAKALGGNVRILYSPLEAVKLALEDPKTQFIFAAVGFETTIPIYAIMLEEILQKNVRNLKLLTSLKTILPALRYICEHEKGIDGFLCPGHVSVIIGSAAYKPLAQQYNKPFVVAGFEGEHVLAAIYEIVDQISHQRPGVKNLYARAVTEGGNVTASRKVSEFFEVSHDHWRGIGVIPDSSLRLKKQYIEFDAGSDLDFKAEELLPKGCRCTDVILGRINPSSCPLFGKACTPLDAVGPCMVSAEGACGIWYKNRGMI